MSAPFGAHLHSWRGPGHQISNPVQGAGIFDATGEPLLLAAAIDKRHHGLADLAIERPLMRDVTHMLGHLFWGETSADAA